FWLLYQATDKDPGVRVVVAEERRSLRISSIRDLNGDLTMSFASGAIGAVDTIEALEVGQGPAADGYGLYGDVFVANDRNNDQPRTIRTGHTVRGTCVARGCEDLAEVVLAVAIGIAFGAGSRAGLDARARRPYLPAV